MSQQINLYNRALLRKRELFTLLSVVLVILVLSVVLFAVGGVLRVNAKSTHAEALALDVKLAEQRSQLAQLSAQPEAVEAKRQLEVLELRLAARREVLAALRSGLGRTTTLGTTGFADYLRGLARQSVGGLWLTGFSVSQGGHDIEIRGRMTESGRLPIYIGRLNSEDVFQGRQFVSLNVDRPVEQDRVKGDQRTPYNSFVLTAMKNSDPGVAP